MENKEPELIDKEDLCAIENELDIEEFSNIEIEVPQMNVSIPETQVAKNDVTQLISDERFLKVLDETIDNIREDRKQVSDYIDTFADLVINEGDSSSSTKASSLLNFTFIFFPSNSPFIPLFLISISKVKISNK